jgi:hypothetical protein
VAMIVGLCVVKYSGSEKLSVDLGSTRTMLFSSRIVRLLSLGLI